MAKEKLTPEQIQADGDKRRAYAKALFGTGKETRFVPEDFLNNYNRHPDMIRGGIIYGLKWLEFPESYYLEQNDEVLLNGTNN